MFRSFVVGLGRSGAGLHLPVLRRTAGLPNARQLLGTEPPLVFDPRGLPGGEPRGPLTGVTATRSLAEAAALAQTDRTVVHVCTPPTARVGVLAELGRLGFRNVLVEKPLALDERGLAELELVRARCGLELVVVAPWLASTLTQRLSQAVAGGELGALRSVSFVQRKPRFGRSLAGNGHPTAFDIELPHSVGVALALAGAARVRHARSEDMRLGEVLLPRLGGAHLWLDHESGVRTRIRSDLQAPGRERRVVVQFEHGTLIGHYPNSDADDYAQLRTVVGRQQRRIVFLDDSLQAFILAAYRHFASPGPLADNLAVNVEVVRLLDAAKRMSAPHPPLARALGQKVGQGVR